MPGLRQQSLFNNRRKGLLLMKEVPRRMDYYNEKEVLLGSILENTQAQTNLIKEDDADGLEALISQRATMMDQVDVLDKQANMPMSQMPPEQSKSIKNILGQIITIDNANQALMNKELTNVKDDLLKIRTGKKQGEHYGSEYGLYKEEGVFFDTKE